jgi:3-dehydroquinate synthetase
VIEVDPYEKGVRQALNLGHTIGHGVELASDFRLSHGEAVGIGTIAEARLAETIGLAERGLSAQIAAVLGGLGLPVTTPADIDFERVIEAMQLDKKRSVGKVRFALPVRVGDVRVGITVDDWQTRVIEQLTKEREG